MKRDIVKIDESKCNGCGLCIPNCAEGALKIVNGKAKLVSDAHCDGLGACLGHCPQDAIKIEQREADPFDEELVAEHLAQAEPKEEPLACGCPSSHVQQFEPAPAQEESLPCGCPSMNVKQWQSEPAATPCSAAQSNPSQLTHWPVKLTLVPPQAPFLTDADVLLVGDCAPVALPDFHRSILRQRPVLIACPKLDDAQAHVKKLAGILQQNRLKSLTIVHMEVPCCHGLVNITKQAMQIAGVSIPVSEVVVSSRGEILSE